MKPAIHIACAALLAACLSAARPAEAQAPPGAANRGAAVLLTGRCHCGAIRYAVRGPVVRCSYCDCRACQRASGSLKAPYVTVLRNNFRLTAGKPAAYRARSGVKCDRYGVWHFCPKCGGPLYWTSDNGKELDVFAASFDDPSVFQPKE